MSFGPCLLPGPDASYTFSAKPTGERRRTEGERGYKKVYVSLRSELLFLVSPTPNLHIGVVEEPRIRNRDTKKGRPEWDALFD